MWISSPAARTAPSEAAAPWCKYVFRAKQAVCCSPGSHLDGCCAHRGWAGAAVGAFPAAMVPAHPLCVCTHPLTGCFHPQPPAPRVDRTEMLCQAGRGTCPLCHPPAEVTLPPSPAPGEQGLSFTAFSLFLTADKLERLLVKPCGFQGRAGR